MPRGGTQGSQIGSFIFDTLIGTGPFAEVWRGRHAHLTGCPVDIKLYTDPVIIETLQSVDEIPWYRGRKTFPPLIAFEPHLGRPFVVTDHVTGTPLRELLKSGPLSPRRVIHFLSQIAGAMKSAHHGGQLHLDLKSDNILITEIDEVHILDLQVGRFSVEASLRHLQLGHQSHADLDHSMAYRTRQQKRGEQGDERTDIYAIGVLMFEMLTGQLPQGKMFPSSLAQGSPRWLDQVFTRCVTRRESRYSSVIAFEKELKRRNIVTQTMTRQRFKSMQVIGPKTVLVSMYELAANRDTVDAQNIETIIKNIEYLSSSGFVSIIFDFSQIAYVSSTGFGYLVNLADAITSRDGKAIICGVQQKVRMILDVLGLARFFVLYENVEQAKAALDR